MVLVYMNEATWQDTAIFSVLLYAHVGPIDADSLSQFGLFADSPRSNVRRIVCTQVKE